MWLLLLQILLGCPMLLSAYEAPEDKEDVFARRACPAFLVFDSAAFLEDMTVELPCRCKPESVHSVVWFYQKHLRAGEGTRVLTDFEGTVLVDSARAGSGLDLRGRFSIRLFSLLIFRAREADSGHYLCGSSEGQFFYGYDIDVQRVLRVTFPPERPAPPGPGPGPGPARAPQRALYRAFTRFLPWSVCDRCGVRGEQTRVGLCYLRSDYLSVRYLHPSSSSSSSSEGAAPCGSGAVPARFRLGAAAKGAELAVRSCHAPCPPFPAAKAERKALLEFLGVAPPAWEVPVLYHTQAAGSPLVLACPGAKPTQAVAWDHEGRPLYRAGRPDGTHRVHIDPGGHLHLRPLALEDRGAYTCWIQGRPAAEIHLGAYLRLDRTRQPSDPEAQHALRALGICYAAYALIFVLLTLARLSWRTLRGTRL